MTNSPVSALIRAWVGLYTHGLPSELRAARRDEIDDDLWCQRQDPNETSRSSRQLASDQLRRLLFGIPADITWRLAYRAPVATAVLERGAAANTRAVGIAAIVAATVYGALIVLFVPFGHALWGGAHSALILAAGYIGVLAFIGAGGGLAWQYQDHIRPFGAVGATVMTVGALMSMGASPTPLIVGSAMLTWDLARIGVVPILAPVVHAATAIAMVAATPLGQPAVADLAGRVAIALLMTPFLLTWLATGATVFRGTLGAARREMKAT